MRCSIQHIRPQVLLIEISTANLKSCVADDSGDDSEDEGDEGERRNDQKRGEEDAEELGESDSPVRHTTE